MFLLPVRQSSNTREAKVLAAGSLVEEIHELLLPLSEVAMIESLILCYHLATVPLVYTSGLQLLLQVWLPESSLVRR